jgi:putative exosortase-associated protein (TIGR04073 family)
MDSRAPGIRQLVATVGLAVILVCSRGAAVAAEHRLPPGAAEKAARGLANAGLGFVVELPKTVYYDTVQHGPLSGLTVGVLEGLGWGIARTLIGIYEVVTFPFPMPEGYRAIYTPALPHQPGKTDVAE